MNHTEIINLIQRNLTLIACITIYTTIGFVIFDWMSKIFERNNKFSWFCKTFTKLKRWAYSILFTVTLICVSMVFLCMFYRVGI